MDERDAVKTGAQVANCTKNTCWASTLLTYWSLLRCHLESIKCHTFDHSARRKGDCNSTSYKLCCIIAVLLVKLGNRNGPQTPSKPTSLSPRSKNAQPSWAWVGRGMPCDRFRKKCLDCLSTFSKALYLMCLKGRKLRDECTTSVLLWCFTIFTDKI